jgi:hypothetical protein
MAERDDTRPTKLLNNASGNLVVLKNPRSTGLQRQAKSFKQLVP